MELELLGIEFNSLMFDEHFKGMKLISRGIKFHSHPEGLKPSQNRGVSSPDPHRDQIYNSKIKENINQIFILPNFCFVEFFIRSWCLYFSEL